jgi:hypothetical protein
MGGGGKKNPLSYVADAIGFTTAATLGGGLGAAAATSSDVQGSVQGAIDNAGLNPSANVTKIENEQKAAESEQKSRDAAMEENKAQGEQAKKYAAKRAKQRGMMGASGGRSSTILTGLGDVSGTGSGSGKTLLGS